MPFLKYANAIIVRPRVSKTEWSNIRISRTKTTQVKEKLNSNLIERASDLFSRPFNPEDYLLTHATIIASVDVYAPPGMKIGLHIEDGRKINRRYADYRVTPDTDKYLNNNNDGWDRDVLLAAYPTFIGGHNFVEHVQVEELSKGRIIDAVARDIGDSIYVDILIATDRKHKDLIRAIENGKMGTLSMGCVIDGSRCTKCGHWAADETEICEHIRYMKGNVFFDDQGRRHRIAELCGHKSISPHGGVQFIEASWVASPAFGGAVLRNILEPSPEISKQAAKILASPPPKWTADSQMKAASSDDESVKKVGCVGTPSSYPKTIVSDNGFLSGWMDDMPEDEGGENGEPKAPVDPLDEVEKELEQYVLDRVKERIKKKIREETVKEELSPEDSSAAPNDTLIKESAVGDARRRLYLAGLAGIIRTATSEAALIDGVADFNRKIGIVLPITIYRAALKVGRHDQYSSPREFKRACEDALGRMPTRPELFNILRLSRLISRGWASGRICGKLAVAKEERNVNEA